MPTLSRFTPDRVGSRSISRRRFLALTGALGIALAGGSAAKAHTGAGDHGGYPDALTHRMHESITPFTDWLASQDARGYLGEFNWPNDLQRNEGDVAQWNAFGERFMGWLDATNLWATAWCVDETQMWGGFWLTAFVNEGETKRAISVPKSQAAVLKAHPTVPGVYERGLNVSSAEDFEEGFSNRNPGVYGKDYWYSGETRDPETGLNTFEYLAQEGATLVRIPFRWERIQRSLSEPLDRTELARLKSCCARAGAAGLKVVIDVHNNAGYYLKGRSGIKEHKIGSPRLPVPHFVDLWRRLSNNFRDDPNVFAYDLMNEPYVHGGIPTAGYDSPQRAWEAYTQKALQAIRERGDNKLVMIPGYAGARHWALTHPLKWISDPANNHRYEAHQYFSRHGGGHYYYSYGEDDAYWTSKGY